MPMKASEGAVKALLRLKVLQAGGDINGFDPLEEAECMLGYTPLAHAALNGDEARLNSAVTAP